MKYLIIALACLVVVQANIRVLRGVYSSGGRFGNSGYGGGQGGYHDNGIHQGGLATGHDVGTVQDDFNTATNHHHEEAHNVGGAAGFGLGAHGAGGHGAYQHGHNNFGEGHRGGIIG